MMKIQPSSPNISVAAVYISSWYCGKFIAGWFDANLYNCGTFPNMGESDCLSAHEISTVIVVDGAAFFGSAPLVGFDIKVFLQNVKTG